MTTTGDQEVVFNAQSASGRTFTICDRVTGGNDTTPTSGNGIFSGIAQGPPAQPQFAACTIADTWP